MDGFDLTTISKRVSQTRRYGLAPDDLRGPQWDHPFHGLVRPAGLAADPTDLLVADAIGLMTPGCALGGWASRRLQGGQMCDGRDRLGEQRDVLIHCPSGARLRRRDGIKPFEGLLRPGEIVDLETITVASLARATFEEMRLARGLREAVVALDMGVSTVLDQARASVTNVAAIVAAHTKLKGIVQCRQALRLGSIRSASPWETRTRLVAAIDAGLDEWEVNVPVFDLAENLLGIADLLDVAAGLVVESDGAGHREEDKHNDDNVREERFERVGLTVVRAGAADHADRPFLARRITLAYADGLLVTRRNWTIEKPGWWWTWDPGRRYD